MKQKTLEIKKSKFVAYLFELESQVDIESNLKMLKKEHKKATHICYAYIYNKECNLVKANDDGEPSGTAGRPILNVLEKKNLKNVMVCVVRYFGGIKLGAGGLVRAYTKSASELFME